MRGATAPMMVEVSYSGGLRLGLPVGIDMVWTAALVRALAYTADCAQMAGQRVDLAFQFGITDEVAVKAMAVRSG